MPIATFRLLVPLPIVVDGGKTRWRVCVEYFGKNGTKAAVMAYCLNQPLDPICITSGRNHVAEAPWNGLRVKLGTTESRILSLLVREGKAEVEPPYSDDDPLGIRWQVAKR